jgi:penicillin amidase
MSRSLVRVLVILLGLLGLVLILAAAGLAYGTYTAFRSFPQLSGELHLSGLEAPVEVYRDQYGVPQIYASTTHDLFFAQGFVHAQDRFYQMDYWRHLGSGRLAELLGETALEYDRFLRTLGWGRIAQQELAAVDPETELILRAYSEGVNAYLQEHSGSELSLEYAVLALINPGYRPEPWEPLHILTWAKAMAWNLGGNMDDEIERALLLKALTPAQLEELYPPFPADNPVILPDFELGEEAGHAAMEPAGSAELIGRLNPLFASTRQRASLLEDALGPSGAGIGSNNWVVSSARTATGKPLLANDPHLSEQMPSIWYEIGLHCLQKGESCPYEVVGFSFAGVPGVIVGHNDRIAWGVTNVGPDVMDLYIEKVNPENPHQYEVNGEWVDMQIVQERLEVGGGEPVDLSVRLTRHGPVITETYLPEGFAGQAGLELPASYAIALRWTALDPSALFRAILGFDRAQNWEEFRLAARDFVVPAQNLVYADVDGNIGYQMPGWIPMRAGGDGRLPVPGWTDEYEWTGYVPYEELPYVFNPERGYVATANQAVVGPGYPYLISTGFDYGFRGRRIVELIESAPGPIDIAYMQQIQGDNKNLTAEALVPVLLEMPLDDERLVEIRSLLQGWDYQNGMDSAPAALFEVFWAHLVSATFDDDLPVDYPLGGGDRTVEIFRRLVGQPDSPWWDNRATPERENREAIFRQAFAGAAAELEDRLGGNPARWVWGDLHTVTFHNESLGSTGIPPIDALFNRGPYRAAGGGDIINATGWDVAEGDYTVRSLPSMRMIIDFSSFDSSQAVHTTGQSGHAFHPHYVDLADLWRNIQYHPLLWSRAQVEAAAEERLNLLP